MPAAPLIRNARRVRRLSQKGLGARAGIAASSLSLMESGKRDPSYSMVEKLLAAAGQTLIAVPTVRADAATIAGRIAEAVQARKPANALRHFIQLADNLAAEHDAIRFALSLAEPSPTGAKHWDAALAAIVAHRLKEEGLPIPAWVESPDRVLKRSWTLSEGRYIVPVSPHRVPPEFLSRKVLVDEVTLVSA